MTGAAFHDGGIGEHRAKIPSEILPAIPSAAARGQCGRPRWSRARLRAFAAGGTIVGETAQALVETDVQACGAKGKASKAPAGLEATRREEIRFAWANAVIP